MKKIIISLLPVVFVLNITGAMAQSATKSTSGSPKATTKATTGKQGQSVSLSHQAPAANVVATPKAATHQPQMSPAEMVQNETTIARQLEGQYTNSLSLTADQQGKVYAACLNYAQSVDEQRTGVRTTPDAARQKLAELRTSVRSLLTSEQQNKMQALQSVKGSISSKN